MELQRFLTQLREQGWTVGAEQFVAVQLLLARLAEADALPENPRELKRYLGPVLCATPRQQTEFRRLFDVWIGPLMQTAAPPPPVTAKPAEPAVRGPTLEDELRALRRRRSASRALLAAAATAVVVAVLRWAPVGGGVVRLGTPVTSTRQPPRTAAVGPTAGVRRAASTVAMLLGIVTISAAGLWFRRRFLARAHTSTPPNVERLSLDGLVGRDWLPPVRRDVAVRMRHREVFEDVELDVERTVEACAEAAGLFAPVYTTRSRVPEYLVLIDRATPDDLRAVRAHAIVDALAADGVYAVVYDFERDPRFAYRERGRRVPLAELHQRHPHHRLVVCGETEGFVSALTGRVHPWVSALARWEHRSLLTLVPVVDWGAPERALMSAGFRLMPASPDGFAAVADARLAQQVIADARSAQVPRYPHRLSADEMLWLDPNVPAREQLRGGLDEVRRYLGETGYAWLAACAVYPEVRPALTLYLGDRMAAPYQAAILERLARLPWMRQALMPDWLRRALVGDLRGEQERSTRGLLRTLLLSPPSGTGAGTTLDVARRNYAELARLWRARVWHWKRDAAAGEPLRDHVFLSWMNDRLSVRVPRALLRWLRARGRWAPRYTSGTLSPDTAHYYQVEHGLALRRLPAGGVGLVSVALIGAVYGGLSHSLNGFFGALANLAALALVWLVVVMVACAVVALGKLRGSWIGGTSGIMCASAFAYGNWWGWINLERGGDRLYDPTALASLVTKGYSHGFADYALWIAEGGAVLLAASAFAARMAVRPFCTTCQTWTTKRRRVYGPLADPRAAIRDILHARYTRLFGLSTTSPHHSDATAATLERCEPSCGATSLLTLLARHSIRDAQGHLLKENDNPLIERLFVPDHVSRALAEWIDATASVRPNLAPAGREALRRAIDVVLTLRAVPSKRWYVYGDIPVDAAKKAREFARIPLGEDIVALAVHSRWGVVAPRYSAYAFTERGVYAYAGTAQFTAYHQVSKRNIQTPLRLDQLLRHRQIDFDLPVAVEAFARIAATRDGA